MLENERLGGSDAGMLFDVCRRADSARSGSPRGVSPEPRSSDAQTHSHYSKSYNGVPNKQVFFDSKLTSRQPETQRSSDLAENIRPESGRARITPECLL